MKCNRCRFMHPTTEKCTALNSEQYDNEKDAINLATEGEGCDVFFSEDDTENISQTVIDVETTTLYEYNDGTFKC